VVTNKPVFDSNALIWVVFGAYAKLLFTYLYIYFMFEFLLFDNRLVIKVKFETEGTFCTYVFSTTPEFFDSFVSGYEKN